MSNTFSNSAFTKPYLDLHCRHGVPFAAYVHYAPSVRVHTSRDLGSGLIVDLDDHNTVIGLEITAPRHVTAQQITTALATFGVGVSELDLAPLAGQ